MATCKYFLQGNCRFGQCCRFAHTTNVNYGDSATLGNKPSSYAGNKTVAFAVAEEVLAVERGGQWPLSCYGPFKERPCIPGMEDFSPDEFHWEMYQAQKSGTVDQTKLQFQQLCQDMKSRRDLLKNPTPEIAAMLESLQKGGQENAFGANNSLTKSSNFSFATPQMGIASTSAPPSSNLFQSKSFTTMNTSNPFGGTVSTFGSAGSTPFGFSSSTDTSISSPFGVKPTFGTNPVFGSSTNPAPPFGAPVKSLTSVFTGANQNPSTFGSQQTQTAFAFNAPPAFGQPAAFGTSTQENTPFGRMPSTQSNVIFGGTTNLTNSVFHRSTSTQTSSLIFGGAQPSSTPLFGSTPQQSSSSIFGGSASAGNMLLGSVPISPFAQSKSNTAFGGGPVFGGAPTFGAQSSPGIFGGQSTFGGVATSTNNVFGGTNATTPTFGSIGQSAPGTFGSVAKSPSTNFGNAQNPPPFGAQISAANAGPFGSAVSTANSPFVTSAGPFSTTTVASTPFSGSNVFGTAGQSVNTSAIFGTTPTQSGTVFETANAGNVPPFGQAASPFGTTVKSPFLNASTTITTVTSSPFSTQSQAGDNSPFKGAGLTIHGSGFATSQTTPFSNSPFASMHKELDVFDETAFTIESQLTDDEKVMYLAKQFVLGKIPLKPPTKELR